MTLFPSSIREKKKGEGGKDKVEYGGEKKGGKKKVRLIFRGFSKHK